MRLCCVVSSPVILVRWWVDVHAPPVLHTLLPALKAAAALSTAVTWRSKRLSASAYDPATQHHPPSLQPPAAVRSTSGGSSIGGRKADQVYAARSLEAWLAWMLLKQSELGQTHAWLGQACFQHTRAPPRTTLPLRQKHAVLGNKQQLGLRHITAHIILYHNGSTHIHTVLRSLCTKKMTNGLKWQCCPIQLPLYRSGPPPLSQPGATPVYWSRSTPLNRPAPPSLHWSSRTPLHQSAPTPLHLHPDPAWHEAAGPSAIQPHTCQGDTLRACFCTGSSGESRLQLRCADPAW